VYTLNRHLNPFAINTDVENGMVHLTGMVESDIDRDLAGEIAKGIDGVIDVTNDLTVAEGTRQSAAAKSGTDSKQPFGAWVHDATTTAVVKSKLIANSNTKGLQIGVETQDDVVTLSGEVSSDETKQLAEELARNTGNVADVHNQLVIAAR
jgi:osmotically-inducible protein OsmY